MDVGVSLVDPTMASTELTALAAEAERLGFASLWTNESTAREAFVTLAGWGHATANARLGTGVCPIYNRPPLTAAMAAATLAESVGRGRVVLGIGAGHPVIGRQFGIDRHFGVAGVEEYLTVVKSLLAGGTVDHHGEQIHLEGARLALSKAVELPVVLAALGPRMLELAVRSADGVLLNWSSPDALAATAQALRESRGDDPFRIAAYVRVACDADASRARAALADELASYLRLPDYRAHLTRQGFDPSTVDPGSVGIAGNPDQVRDRLDGYGHAAIDELVVRPVPVGTAGVAAAVAATAP
jgi:5,10-methylenetetrahydromethanopterin reductase